MKEILVIISFIILVSCIQKKPSKELKSQTNASTVTTPTETINKASENIEDLNSFVPTLIEKYIDSLSFGNKYKLTIELNQLFEDEYFVNIKFYKLGNQIWNNVQEFNVEKDPITGLEVIIADFNEDGYNDFSFQNGVTARGANELRTHFLFDSNGEKLNLIKNSNEYPNLRFNPDLKCYDSWLVYGGSSTLFLRLENDLLTEFAGVDCNEIIEAYTIDKNRKRQIISSDSLNCENRHRRYLNYAPLIEWKN